MIERTMDEYIKMKQMLESSECTFRPKLNKVSEKLSGKRKKSESRSNSGGRSKNEVFDKLYEDSKSHGKRLEAYTQRMLKKSCPFKPSLANSKSFKSKDFETKRNIYLKKLIKHKKEH